MKDSYKVYEAVIKGKLVFPGYMGNNFPSKPLITQLLSRNPEDRGTPASIMESSPWFKGYNFEDLLSKSVRPRYVPKLKEVEIDQRGGKSIQSACEREEQAERDQKPPKKPSPPGWDQDF